MKVRAAYVWYRLRSSFWFVPGLLAALSIGLSFGTVAIDRAVYETLNNHGGWFGIEAARSILATVAGSMITVTSLVFSLTLVALILASQQLGPRLISVFMRDPLNQIVLGVFIATFMYALLVLRTVREAEGYAFVPYLSVVIALGLVVLSLGVLIYFIHHVAVSIQADSVVANVAQQMDRMVRQSLRSDDEHAASNESGFEDEMPADIEATASTLAIERSGYIQAIDIAVLVACAAEHDIIIRLERRPGHFLTARTVVARTWPPERVSDAVCQAIRRAVVVGPRRTQTQDIEYAIASIVEIALRALSPGVNDPHTALACVDRLGAVLETILCVGLPPRYRADSERRLRVITEGTTVEGALDAAFNQIRQNAQGNTAVTIRLVEVLTVLVGSARHQHEREAIRKHAEMIGRSAEQFIFEDNDRAAVRERLERFFECLARA